MLNFAAILKYLLEGFAVALAAFYIPQRKVDLKEIVLIALTAAAVFSILDQFSPVTGENARRGAGFGIGLNQIGLGGVQNDYYGFYGGQDPRLSCTCEVDADYLRSQVFTENSSSNSSVSNASNNGTGNVSGNANSSAQQAAVNAAAAASVAADAAFSAVNASDSEPDRVNIIDKNGDKTTYRVRENGSNVSGQVEPFDGFAQMW